jgi:quinohemoprotein ethanol dehydrogenase
MVHAPDRKWKYDPSRDNVGFDVKYHGPLYAKMAAMPKPSGELLAWDPIGQKAVWAAKYPVTDRAGVLATGGI